MNGVDAKYLQVKNRTKLDEWCMFHISPMAGQPSSQGQVVHVY